MSETILYFQVLDSMEPPVLEGDGLEALTMEAWVNSEGHSEPERETLVLAKGERLDKALAEALGGRFSRVRIQQLMTEGHVRVDGIRCVKGSKKTEAGEAVEMSLPEAVPLQLIPEPLPLEIVYQDDHMVVVNKPVGMLTHPLGTQLTGTLVNALLYHCAGELSGINGVIRPGIVHRLDRDTSGLLMVAKTDQAHRHLAEQIKQRMVKREYWALVQGKMPSETGTVDAPIARNPKHRQKMQVHPEGRHAVTHWEVLETIHDQYAYLKVSLETGRTHQIRVHLSHIHHPILGDPLYGSGVEKILKLPTQGQGQLLQAFRLRFTHPQTEEAMAFEIPPHPRMSQAWAFLTGE